MLGKPASYLWALWLWMLPASWLPCLYNGLFNKQYLGLELPWKFSKLTYIMCSEQQLPLREHANVNCCCCSGTFSKDEARHFEKARRAEQRGWLSSCFRVEVIWAESRPPRQSVRHLCWWASTHQALSDNCWNKGVDREVPCVFLVIQWKGGDLVDWTLSFLCPMRKKKSSEGRLEKLMYMYSE